MRICLVSREYPIADHGGGIGTYTEKTARALVALGHTVDVLTEATAEPSVSVVDGVTVHFLDRSPATRLRTLARAWAVDRAIRRLTAPPQVVQACEFGAEAVLYSLRRPRSAKLVTRLATPSFAVRELNQHGVDSGLLPRLLLDVLERVQTRRSDAITSISQAIADVVCERWNISPDRVTALKTGVDFHMRFASQASGLPSELEGQRFVLFFGRLEERKGVHVLARALTGVMDDHPELHAVFAGNAATYQGRPMDDYVRGCNPMHLDRLHFLPRQPQRDLFGLLAHARLVVLPSLWEGLGNVALEALDMGKPIVATSGSGFSDVIEDGLSGVLVPPGDVEALGAALSRLLDDTELSERLARGALDRARSFELTSVAADLVSLYQRLVAQPAASSRGFLAQRRRR
ncbi:MAG: glycosyltransferase family 4 protein [Acidimicrobiales bacterium]